MTRSTATHKDPRPFCPTGEILTSTGLYVTPLDMQPEMLSIKDIAHHLSNLCRFTGAVSTFYSVAQHSVLVAGRLIEEGEPDEVVFAGLMHDAAEAYIGDMSGPLKDDPEYAGEYLRAEERLERAISEKYGVEYPFPPAVKAADKALYLIERNSLMPHNGVVVEGEETPKGRIIPWSQQASKAAFLMLFNTYTNH